jgi:tetratricopeptide (TPR) repeat protein
VWVLERAAESAAAAGDDRTEAEVLLQTAAVRFRQNTLDAALRAASRALSLADRLGDPTLSGRAVLRIAEITEATVHQGLLDAGSEPLFDHAVELLAGFDDERHAHALRGRGRVRRRAGRPSAALLDLRVALGLYRALGHLPGAAASWREIAEAERARGERCAAIAAYRSSLHTLAAAGDATAAGWARLEAGELRIGETPEPRVDALLAARIGGDTDASRTIRALHALGDGPPWSAVAALLG